MTAGRTLALVATPEVAGGVEALVRLCVGLMAAGERVDLAEIGPGRGVLSGGGEKPAEVERQLEALAAGGVVPRPLEATDVADHLARAAHVLRAADPGRRGTPEILIVDDAYLAEAVGSDLVHALCVAGQVLRDARPPA